MKFGNIVLIHRENGKFSREGFKVQIDECFENIKAFYEEQGIVYLILNLEKDFTDEEFDFIIENISYDDFNDIGVSIFPRDNEYYPTFVVEIKVSCEDDIKLKVNETLRIFMEKVVEIHCNNF